MRNERRVIEGVVLKAKMDKTVVVSVTRQIRHPLYGKLIQARKKYFAHTVDSSLKEGDRVRIAECRPLSKCKRFRVVEVMREQP
ncbi:MAG: 30S ribosomal protein S17 [Parachlamydiales bacterium]|nr:30S ribosomal protein S17 [Parachlamydiales bacterium]